MPDAKAKPKVTPRTALDQFGQVRRMFQSVIDIADAMEGVEDLERSAAEKRVILHQLDGEVADRRAAIAKAKDEAAAIVAKAKDDAAAVKADADKHVEAATAAAEAKVRDAAAETAHVKQASHDAVTAANKRLTAINGKVEDAEQTLAGLTAKIEEAQAKVAEILGTAG